jgi:3-isopropylmalate/(R)-2-methylmalate dehydratase small subunit
MDPFTTFKAIAVPIDIANCDTDQIIPGRFLRRPRTDPEYPRFLFHDLRFETDGSEKDFIFNKPPYRDAKIVVADINWGCGSSRENAVTALVVNGIRAVIAPSIGDIHYSNCTKRGVLPVVLSRADCATLRAQLHGSPGAEIALDLEAQTVTGPDGTIYPFEIRPFDRHRLLNGLDDIAVTLEYEDAIAAFERKRRADADWLF